MNFKQTFTLTFGDQGENHVGMQKIGQMAKKGFTLEDLLQAKKFFERKGAKVEIYHLNKLLKDVKAENAYVLVAKNGVNVLMGKKNSANDLYKEQDELEKDTKAFMYGRVVDKKARYNLCFSEENQEPDYENRKGRIVAYENVPLMKMLMDRLGLVVGEKAKNLIVEGNYYYRPDDCYIGFHGDSERRKVIGVRLGKSFTLHYQWYGIMEYDEKATRKAKMKNSDARDRKSKKKLGKRLELLLNHGDLYIMSEKAVGTDWKSNSIITLRHAAGKAKEIDLNPEFTKGEDCLYEESEYEVDEEGYVVVEFV